MAHAQSVGGRRRRRAMDCEGRFTEGSASSASPRTEHAVTFATMAEVADELLEMLGANRRHLPTLRGVP
jgi:hypothetical protein